MSEQTTANAEDVLTRLAQLEDAVQRSGHFDGIDAPEFSADGVAWTQTWPQEADPPVFGRVAVYRKDVRRPYEQPLAWADVVPAVDEWRELWLRKPMPLFGAALKRDAFRHMFRDVVGEYRDPSEDLLETPTAAAAPERAWEVEIAAAATPAELDAIERDARAARVFTPDAAGTALHRTLKDRRREFARTAWDTPAVAASAPVPEVAASVPDEEIVTVAEAVERARRAPQDHLPPTNRAARRAKSKGRRK